MSCVSGITVLASCCEGIGDDDEGRPCPQFEQLNDWLEANGKFRALKPLEDHFGGGKHPQMFASGAGINGLNEDDFAEFYLSLSWECPENAVLVIQPEDGPTRVVRPHFAQERV